MNAFDPPFPKSVTPPSRSPGVCPPHRHPDRYECSCEVHEISACTRYVCIYIYAVLCASLHVYSCIDRLLKGANTKELIHTQIEYNPHTQWDIRARKRCRRPGESLLSLVDVCEDCLFPCPFPSLPLPLLHHIMSQRERERETETEPSCTIWCQNRDRIRNRESENETERHVCVLKIALESPGSKRVLKLEKKNE